MLLIGVVYGLFFTLDSLVRKLFGIDSMAGMVAIHLGAAMLAISTMFLFGMLKPDRLPEVEPIPKRTAFTIVVVGLAVVVVATAFFREWWLAMEMVAFLAVLVGVVMYMQLFKPTWASASAPQPLPADSRDLSD
ncbi:MAG: hypothetical protein V4558_16015 [Gemmatimonadota bacterium]